ncbi:hypothetical protein QOZ80_4AG0301310 [Eleusine coracana subsp. coracana]|nr:hypothetical protein QOZ80_4AG0301310 [Eleusine coracana subsp. coracana]
MMEHKDVITLKVFSGALFNMDSMVDYAKLRTISDFDRDLMSYFKLRDQLKDCGFKEEDWLYYLKPRMNVSAGLMLITNDSQCNELLSDHEGKDTCILYIVPSPMVAMREYARLLREDADINTLFNGCGATDLESVLQEGMQENIATPNTTMRKDNTFEDGLREVVPELVSDDSYNIEVVPKHEVKNRFVDTASHVFEGDIGNEDLYILKNQPPLSKQDASGHDKNEGNVKEKPVARCKVQPKKNAVADVSENVDGNHTRYEAYDTSVYVHRSRGLEDHWFDDKTMRHPILNESVVY